MPKVGEIYASQPIILCGRSVNGSTAVSKTAGLCSNHNGRVKSDHLHFSKLTYQKLLENAIGGSDMTVPSAKVLVKVYVMLSRQNPI